MSKKEKIYNVFYCWQSDDSNTKYLTELSQVKIHKRDLT